MARRARARRRVGPSLPWFALALTVAGGACYHPVRERCIACVVLGPRVQPVALPAGTRTAYLIVPGLLGLGWEWDEPLAHLARQPASSLEAFDWRPTASPAQSAHELAEVANARLARAPGLERLVIVGHSAGGIVTTLAAAELRVPQGRSVLVANIGTPYAGMHTMPFDEAIAGWNTPLVFSIGASFRDYPPPAPGVRFESWVTPWPGDPVMMPRFGHHPDDPTVGPPGPRHRAPPDADHNRYLARVIAELVGREQAHAAAPATGAPDGAAGIPLRGAAPAP